MYNQQVIPVHQRSVDLVDTVILRCEDGTGAEVLFVELVIVKVRIYHVHEVLHIKNIVLQHLYTTFVDTHTFMHIGMAVSRKLTCNCDAVDCRHISGGRRIVSSPRHGFSWPLPMRRRNCGKAVSPDWAALLFSVKWSVSMCRQMTDLKHTQDDCVFPVAWQIYCDN